MKRRRLLWYALMVLAGCKGVMRGSNSRIAIDKLRFTGTDVLELKKLEQDYGQFRTVLEEVLGVNIEFLPLDKIASVASVLQLNLLDLALAGPSEYVLIRSRTNAVPVIAITRPNYRSVIAVSTESSIRSLTDLKGKTLVLSDIGSTSGHLGPTSMLIKAGLNPKTDLTIEMRGDEGSILAMKEGEVDAWGGSALDYQEFLDKNRFPIIAESSPLPSDIFVAGSQLERGVVEQIRTLMINNQSQLMQALMIGETTKKYKGSKLVSPNDTDYDVIEDVYRVIGQGIFIDTQ